MLRNAHALLVCVRTLSVSAFIHPSSLHLLRFNLHFKVSCFCSDLHFTLCHLWLIIVSMHGQQHAQWCQPSCRSTSSLILTLTSCIYLPFYLSLFGLLFPSPPRLISLASQHIYSADLQQYIPSLNSCFI